jgi:Double-GTPase 2
MKNSGAGSGRAGERAVQAAREFGTRLVGARGEDAIIDVTMLGSTGVGKTTLLASMYDCFDRTIGSTDLAMRPMDMATSAHLQKALTTLRGIPRDLTVQHALQGTGVFREYQFGVGRKGRPPTFALRFNDYPGKLLADASIPADLSAKLEARMDRADVVVIAVDVPALVERDGMYHDLVNVPQIVTDTIKRMLEKDTTRLIILAALKCERYVETEAQARLLAKQISDAYRGLLSYIGSPGDVQSRSACVLTPVQTLGSVVFSRIEPTATGPIFHYRARRIGARYEPADTDQPLRYALSFIVNKYRASQRGLLKAWWEQFVGTDAALVAAVDSFADGCKTDGGFMILKDHVLLQPGRHR